MNTRNLSAYRNLVEETTEGLLGELTNARSPEAALAAVTTALTQVNGDRHAHEVPGALKDGEVQYFIAGCFLLSPDRTEHVLVAENGFPPEQHRLRIPHDLGHPGWVLQNRSELLLANTDKHADFKQILKTSRMGSAIYAPMFWQGEFLGQMINAAQARNTMSQTDLATLRRFTAMATLAYVALGGLNQAIFET